MTTDSPLFADAAELPLDDAAANNRAGRWIKRTRSLCPDCLKPIDADVRERGGQVWMDKECDQHGRFSALLAAEARHYHEPGAGPRVQTACCGGGCDPAAGAQALGATGSWSNHSCTVLIEITERCNLSCPTCFAGSSPQHAKMMSLDTFAARLDGLEAGGKRGADMIQLSGGEPTIHPELVAMVDLAFTKGFLQVCINSNGIKLAQAGYVERLTDVMRAHPGARLFVYLQFDGFDNDTHSALRGRGDLLAIKRRALTNCLDAGIRVHPVMTLTRDINDHEVGAFVSVAVDEPRLKHVVIQPAMYSGRYDNPRRADRLTLADTVALVVEQFGVFAADDFGPIPCSDPNCHGIAVALRTADGLMPVSRYFPRYDSWASDGASELIAAFSDTLDGPSAFSAAIRWATAEGQMSAALEALDDDEIDRVLDALVDLEAEPSTIWDRLLTISIKPFMDAWTYDQDRIDQCCVHILDNDGQPVSFCQFNAVNRPIAGRRGSGEGRLQTDRLLRGDTAKRGRRV